MSRARATEPVPASAEDAQIVALTEPAIGLGSMILFRGADKQVRPAIVTFVWDQNSVHAVVFGNSHDDSEAGLKCGVFRSGDHWITG